MQYSSYSFKLLIRIGFLSIELSISRTKRRSLTSYIHFSCIILDNYSIIPQTLVVRMWSWHMPSGVRQNKVTCATHSRRGHFLHSLITIITRYKVPWDHRNYLHNYLVIWDQLTMLVCLAQICIVLIRFQLHQLVLPEL